MITTSNLYQAREIESQRYNIYDMLTNAVDKGVLRLDTSSKKDWFKGLHKTTKKALLGTCDMYNIKIIVC